jgi:hypothetical protein
VSIIATDIPCHLTYLEPKGYMLYTLTIPSQAGTPQLCALQLRRARGESISKRTTAIPYGEFTLSLPYAEPRRLGADIERENKLLFLLRIYMHTNHFSVYF